MLVVGKLIELSIDHSNRYNILLTIVPLYSLLYPVQNLGSFLGENLISITNYILLPFLQ